MHTGGTAGRHMAVRSNVDWEACGDGCIGVRLLSGGRCWEHAKAQDVGAALEQLRHGGDLDGRGVTFTPELLRRLLNATPGGDKRRPRPRVQAANFERAIFKGGAEFGRTTFEEADFRNTTFEGFADFYGATFEGALFMFPASPKHGVDFREATFKGTAWFGLTLGNIRFTEATFEGDANFDDTTFNGDAVFRRAIFKGDANFRLAIFKGDANFKGATIERARQLGPMAVGERLVLNGALFRERIQIEVSAAALTCERTRFLAGVQMRVRWAEIVLDDADLAAQSVVSSADPFPNLDEEEWPWAPESPWPVDCQGTPRLLSVRGADVAGLTVAGVDLQACRFVDAHYLDQLRAEASKFTNTPRGWRWSKRRSIAEEQQWRASQVDGQGWYGLESQPPDWLELKPRSGGPAGTLRAADIARLYRELRKGLEDGKDEPGAADFYYGEMEMRRHAKRQQIGDERRAGNLGAAMAAATECAILWLYWLVSGYALRAWRALASLAAVVLIASVIFAFWGFAAPDPPAFRPVEVNSEGALVYEPQPQVDRPAGAAELPTALRVSAQATTALLRGPDAGALTAVGEWLQIALRLIGPVLLGLAVLSVRGRVKR
jgi:uncharacterized protein YjbI with pentapeptide repeats